MQSYADENKNTKDSKSSLKASAVSDKKSSSQHSGQDNFAYRSEAPSQANQGQQIIGKNNEATGMNDQSKNLQSTTATTGAAGGTRTTGNGTTPTPPTTGTLNVCKVVVDNFDLGVKPSDFTFTATSEGAEPAKFPGRADCTKVTVPEGPYGFIETVSISFFIITDVTGDCALDFPQKYLEDFMVALKTWGDSDLHGY